MSISAFPQELLAAYYEDLGPEDLLCIWMQGSRPVGHIYRQKELGKLYYFAPIIINSNPRPFVCSDSTGKIAPSPINGTNILYLFIHSLALHPFVHLGSAKLPQSAYY